jgi:hypothetical protein
MKRQSTSFDTFTVHKRRFTMTSAPSPENRAVLVVAGFAVLVLLSATGCRQAQQSTNQQPTANVSPTATPSASNTASQEKKEDNWTAPTVTITKAFSRTKKLGDPMEVSGTLSNPNDFAISNIEVTFMHMDAGEDKDVVLFENKPVPAKATVPWKASVIFERGHFPEALISMVGEWKKAQ